jgi:hypothetical protein
MGYLQKSYPRRKRVQKIDACGVVLKPWPMVVSWNDGQTRISIAE